MDAQKPNLNSGDSLPETDNVFRIVDVNMRDRENRSLPAVRCFTLSDDDKMSGYTLSVEWEQKTTPEESIARLGASFKKGREEYKPYQNKEIYLLQIGYIKHKINRRYCWSCV